MGVTRNEYYAQLVNTRTKRPIEDDTGEYIVLTAGEAQPADIYTTKEATTKKAYTALTSASTMTNGVIQFWTAADVDSVDITIVTETGHAVFVAGLTPSQHRIDVTEEEIRQVMVAPYYASIAGLTATASAWGNGLAVPANSWVYDVYVKTTVLGTTSTIDFGLSGDLPDFITLHLILHLLQPHLP
jgi:hypothetical protein